MMHSASDASETSLKSLYISLLAVSWSNQPKVKMLQHYVEVDKANSLDSIYYNLLMILLCGDIWKVDLGLASEVDLK